MTQIAESSPPDTGAPATKAGNSACNGGRGLQELDNLVQPAAACDTGLVDRDTNPWRAQDFA